jgi:hypothetical protein
MGASTHSPFKPGERIPGLAVGGWFDAGDFDIQGGSHAATVSDLVALWETFRPQRDHTLVDQARHFVDIHRPDGKPDVLQQIEHGTLAIAAQHRVLGRLVRGIVDGRLDRYHHLGDAATQTDNLIYDPALKPYETRDGRSGTPDDRWVFTDLSPSLNYSSIGALAGASRALRGFNDPLAAECLELAKKAYAEERVRVTPASPPTGFESRFGQFAEMNAVLQLFTTTKEPAYRDRFLALIWPALESAPGFAVQLAVRAMPVMDAAYAEKLRPYAAKYAATLPAMLKQNPYGVPIATGGWAGNGGVVGWSTTNYYLHKAYPDLVPAGLVTRGLDYLFGTHPAHNLSFVSAVGGTQSKRLAYGNNRADFAFIPGGIVPGVLVLKPDYPENMDDWPFLWGENEYVIGLGASYLFLVHAAQDVDGK